MIQSDKRRSPTSGEDVGLLSRVWMEIVWRRPRLAQKSCRTLGLAGSKFGMVPATRPSRPGEPTTTATIKGATLIMSRKQASFDE
jgi:hypothetical protein